MKNVLIMLVLNLCFMAGVAPALCQANEGPRVAILPVFNSSHTYDHETERVIYESLQTRFSVLLAKTAIFYNVIPPEELALALPTELKLNKSEKINAALLRELGAKVQADIVIGAQIMDFRLFTSRNLDNDLLMQTDLTIRVLYYDASPNQIIDIQGGRHYNGRAAAVGNADYLAKEIMEHLIGKVGNTWKR